MEASSGSPGQAANIDRRLDNRMVEMVITINIDRRNLKRPTY